MRKVNHAFRVSSLSAHGAREQPSWSSRCNSCVSRGHGGSWLSHETRLSGASCVLRFSLTSLSSYTVSAFLLYDKHAEESS